VSTPSIAVVVPAFNAARTIGATLTSLLSQTLAGLEIVVVDDGSTDGTAEVVRATAPGATLVSQPNAGVGAARARGIAESTSSLVTFCDADDLLFDLHVQRLYETWQREAGGGIATANAYWWLPGGIDPGKTRHRGRFPAPVHQRIAILQSNFVSSMSMFPRTLVDEIGTFDASMRLGEDWDFWIRAILAGHTVAHQATPLALYRWATDGLSSRVTEFRAAERLILERVAERPDLTDAERAVVRRRLTSAPPADLANAGDDALRKRQYRRAAQHYTQAAHLVPHESALVAKARLLRWSAGLAGPVLRRRQEGRERALGVGDAHRR
jgi:glycosyltransferase involved in cell wall biosynthesis